jgi:SP family sugar:H+ symporter-like MFS transporter
VFHNSWYTVPAPARGLIVGTYQFSLALGGWIINLVCRSTSFLPDSRAWRIPLCLFYIIPTIIATGIFFIPESPRWLLMNNKADQARESLRALRRGRFDEAAIDAEFSELQLALEQETEKGTFAELWRKTNLKRTVIVMGVNFFQQATGQAFSSQYGTIYVKSLGTVNPFNFTLITSAINIVTLVITLLFNDRTGRR